MRGGPRCLGRGRQMLNKTARKCEIRPKGMLQLLAVKGAGEGGDDASVQQSIERTMAVARRHQIEIKLQHRLQQTIEPFRRDRVEIRNDSGDSAGAQALA